LFQAEGCTFECGYVYGLVGPNGAGKSSFAKLLASKTLPGFPDNISTCYLDACGLKSDGKLVPKEYLLRHLESRTKTIKAAINELEEKLADAAESSSADVESIASRLGSLYVREEDLFASAEENVDGILDKLGFSTAKLTETFVSDLSSGWRYKCELAGALLSAPDLLILDEPSFLDTKSTQWLIHEVKKVTSNGVIVCLISHKESLLSELSNRILFISAAKELETYNCGYEVFKSVLAKNTGHAQKEYKKDEAKQTKADKSLKRIQQQLKKSERKNSKKLADGEDARFIQGKSKEAKQKADRSQASKIKQLQKGARKMEELAKKSKSHSVCPIPITGNRCDEKQQLIALQNVSFAYYPEHKLLDDVSCAVYGGDRIALIGHNGQGKSTIIKLLVEKLHPIDGNVSQSALV